MMYRAQKTDSGARFGSFAKAALLLAAMLLPAFADGHHGMFGPELPGVYIENNGQYDWAPVRSEQALMAELTASGSIVQARLDRGASRATLYAPMRLAVRIHEMEDIASYRVYRVRASSDARTIRLNKPVPVQWVEIGFHLYEIRLPADLNAGEFAIVPPAESAERIYPFRYEPLRAPRNQALAFR